MRQHGLVAITVVTVFLTGVMMARGSLPGRRPVQVSARSVSVAVEAGGRDSYASQVARRWRQPHSSHWRTLLLQQ
jgi:hypothetical protein